MPFDRSGTEKRFERSAAVLISLQLSLSVNNGLESDFKMKRILLCCNAGMSTSLLVQKMKKEVESRGLDVSIKALPMGQAMEHIDEADVVLLGPQIGYARSDFEKATDVPVAVIPMADYGRMNAKKVIDDALTLLG